MRIDQHRIDYFGAAQGEFLMLPPVVIAKAESALDLAASGLKAHFAKPLKIPGMNGGRVLEIVLNHAGNTYRVVYTTYVNGEIWVIRAFMKKSSTGIKTAKSEIDLIAKRIRALMREKGLI